MTGLSVRSVCVRYPSGGGVNTGPFTLKAGHVTALLGPNGSGKSSLLKALIGAVSADVQALIVDGHMIDTLPQRARTLSYLSQTRLGPALASVETVIGLGRYPHKGADPDNRVESVLETLNLVRLRKRPFGTLSGGEQARVLLGRALAVNAPILLADEPIAALDPYYALNSLAALRVEAQRGHAILVSLHDLDLAERFCDSAIILKDGELVAQGPMTDTLSPDILRNVFRVQRLPTGLSPL